MNQTQLKYAKERAEGIFKRAKENLKTKHTVPAFRLSREERFQALEQGHFKIDRGLTRHHLEDQIIFFAENNQEFNQIAHDADLAKLTLDYNKLLDELVLGDNQEALKLLQAFEVANG